MSRFISIILLSCFLQQLGQRVYIFIDYEVNKEYITVKFCENRMKPGSQCHGKCQMAKKLSEGMKKEIPPSGHQKQVQDIQFFTPTSPLENQEFRSAEKVYFAVRSSKIPNSHNSRVFHPPCKQKV